MCLWVLLLLCTCLGVPPAGGQSLSFGAYAIEDGLSANPITDVLQDQQGLLWIGTVDGLNRFDGYNFKIYRHVPGDANALVDNYIHAIARDSKGYLWIGTVQGLSRYDPYLDTFTSYTHHPDSVAGLSHNRVLDVYVDASDRVWIATLGGLDVLDAETGRITNYRHDPQDDTSIHSNFVLSVVAGEEPYIWIGTSAGVARYSRSTGRFEQVYLDDQIWSLYRAPDGNIWAGGTKGRLYHIDPITHQVSSNDLFAGRNVPEGPGYVTDIMMDDDGLFWSATYGGGLFLRKDGTWHQFTSANDAAASLTDNRVSVLFQDLTGKQWIGTWSGLNYVGQTKAFQSLDLKGIGKVRSTLVDRAGALWIGTEENGLIHFRNGEALVYDVAHKQWPLPSNQVSTMLEDHQGNVWVGSPAWGIVIFYPETGTSKRITGTFGVPGVLPTNQIYRIIEDRSNRVWVATVQGGLSVYDRLTDTFTTFVYDSENPESISSNEVITLYEDNTGQLWAGTIGGGLNRVDIHINEDGALDVKFKRYQVEPGHATSISSNNVISLYRDDAGILWVGTMGGGLNRFDPEQESFTSWKSRDGLPHDNVACILPDNAGRLWLPTTLGLARFNPETEQFNVYTAADGLESPVFYFGGCSADTAGNFYLSHTRGVTVFNPAEIEHNDVQPAALISEVLLFNEPYVMDSSALYKQVLDLDHDQNFLAFAVGATDYTIPEKNRYRYKLEGIDADWVYDRGIRLANYPSLQPGAYTFMVEASNNDGVWSDARSMVVIIASPYWQRWWFILSVFLGIVGLIAGFFMYRNLQQKSLFETRQQIADDLHDDITGDLAALTFFLGRMRNTESMTDQDREDASDYFGKVQRMMGDVRDVVWLADPGFDTLGKLIDRMHMAGRQLASNHTFEMASGNIPLDQELSLNLRRHLFLMYKEALHNAVQHAAARTIKVAVNCKNRKLLMTIEDDGIGFDPLRNYAGKGIRSLHNRAEQGGISLRIDSFKGRGTIVVIEAEMT